MINNNIDIKEKYVEMCKLIFINKDGVFKFPFEDLQLDNDWNSFTTHQDYTILETKMNNLLNLVNQNPQILNLDVETEIWEMV
jgi:hypothetical protein